MSTREGVKSSILLLPGPCLFSGACTNSNGSFSCACQTGFSGFRCQYTNVCSTAMPCPEDLTCVATTTNTEGFSCENTTAGEPAVVVLTDADLGFLEDLVDTIITDGGDTVSCACYILAAAGDNMTSFLHHYWAQPLATHELTLPLSSCRLQASTRGDAGLDVCLDGSLETPVSSLAVKPGFSLQGTHLQRHRWVWPTCWCGCVLRERLSQQLLNRRASAESWSCEASPLPVSVQPALCFSWPPVS